MNRRSRVLDQSEYEKVIQAIKYGFVLEGHTVRPSPRLSAICICQANTGLRVGDVLNLKLSSFTMQNGRYYIDVQEQKTRKKRFFPIATEVYSFLQNYALENNISKNEILFPITARAVNKQLNKVGKYLGISNLSSHSFRKFWATNLYNKSNYNIEIVRIGLLHSSASISQKYIGINPKVVEQALLDNFYIPSFENLSENAS